MNAGGKKRLRVFARTWTGNAPAASHCACAIIKPDLNADAHTRSFWDGGLYFTALSVGVSLPAPGGGGWSTFGQGVHPHRRTQDFIMERVHVTGAGPGSLGDGSPPGGPGVKPW